mmetsp:Transcript_97249/g.208635  ORF Transcript_97249/g.208635 Transcript_97249/m.208635 type:complete len:399 (-) Transcript_97249:1109-2305(-)
MVLHALWLHLIFCGGQQPPGGDLGNLRGAPLCGYLPPLCRDAALGFRHRQEPGGSPVHSSASVAGLAWPGMGALDHRENAADAVLVPLLLGGLLGSLQAILPPCFGYEVSPGCRGAHGVLLCASLVCRLGALHPWGRAVVQRALLRSLRHDAGLGCDHSEVPPCVLPARFLSGDAARAVPKTARRPQRQSLGAGGDGDPGAHGLPYSWADLLLARLAASGGEALGAPLRAAALAVSHPHGAGGAAGLLASLRGEGGGALQLPRKLLLRGLRLAICLLPSLAGCRGRDLLLSLPGLGGCADGALGAEALGVALAAPAGKQGLRRGLRLHGCTCSAILCPRRPQRASRSRDERRPAGHDPAGRSLGGCALAYPGGRACADQPILALSRRRGCHCSTPAPA